MANICHRIPRYQVQLFGIVAQEYVHHMFGASVSLIEILISKRKIWSMA